ncbi:MAG: ATP-binding protein [Bacteroidia bacterium]
MQADTDSHAQESRAIWQLSHELSQANDSLQRLGHMVSHDLRGPLANMEALLGLFDRENMGASDHPDLLNLLGHAVGDLRQHLDDLNDLLKSKHPSGQLWEDTDLTKEFHHVKHQLLNQLTQAKGTIDTCFEVISLHSVKLYVQSIVYNLLSNSIKYRDPSRELTVRFKTEETEANVRIIVEDNGLGIDLKTNRERLFKPYTRLQHDGDGFGLGLYLVKSQVEALNGWLEVASKPGEGTSFTVVLPKKQP